MVTTITTAHSRTPLLAALAVGAALVAGGAIGVAWEQNHDDSPAAVSQTRPTTPESFGGATTSDGISGSVSGDVAGTPRFGGATTGQESTQ